MITGAFAGANGEFPSRKDGVGGVRRLLRGCP
jgi:hypothetical protein